MHAFADFAASLDERDVEDLPDVQAAARWIIAATLLIERNSPHSHQKLWERAQLLRSAAGNPSDTPPQRLTARELEYVRWTIEGKSSREIARLLDINEQTATFHLRNAIRKLEVTGGHSATTLRQLFL